MIAVVALGLTACTNTEISSVGTTTTVITTTTIESEVATTTPEQTTTEQVTDEITTTTVNTTVTTTPEQTTTPKVTTTVKPTTVTTTTKKVTTTPKVTTTTKKATTTTKKKVTTTTAKKTTPKATTTTKKPTTTTKLTTTKKQEITKPQQTIKITQSDVDRLVAELQEYSNSKADGYKQYFPEGSRFSFEDAVAYNVSNKTPSNSSWHNVTSWYECQSTKYDLELYEDMLSYIKRQIDFEYSILPNTHQVVYAEYTTNSHTGATKWDIYLLY